MTQRHAATIAISLAGLAKALDLPDTVTVLGVVGLPLNVHGLVELLVTHDALPTVAELCAPVHLDVEQIQQLVVDR